MTVLRERFIGGEAKARVECPMNSRLVGPSLPFDRGTSLRYTPFSMTAILKSPHHDHC
jgi:hypothetical protein